MSGITGGCLCGACRYASSGPVMNVRACHCHRCQKATGAPLYARVMVARDTVTIDGPVAWYDAGTGVERGFCPTCGCTLFSARPAAGTIGLTMGSLDDPAPYHPQDHIWTEAIQPWLKLADGAPHHPKGPPA
ncbi:GFA family protein [Sphingomonas sp. Leaf25]|uniref:GFA family protein n=1 Tax=Sphingomonas sp. Leaf25 TaxID=1735692 RepID=UPI0006F45ED7|nr:GFA family protein [Sphingomonas sp. Leaf25]KQN03692.1 aldehyde-activating protein [Sphingomonas sp. Leaf25]